MTRAARIKHYVRELLTAAGLLPVRVGPWLHARVASRHYRVLDPSQLLATRRSDTVFIFGSGASLNELTPEEWRTFAEHDTFGFNWFIREDWVRCDYHLIRDIADRDPEGRTTEELREYFAILRANPHFADTIYLVQKGLRALSGNRAIALRQLPDGSRIFRFRALGGQREPSRDLRRGIARAHATLEDCVNFAYLIGWRRIVLVGVDLYDRRYFWLPPDEARLGDAARGATAADPHTQATSGQIEQLGEWTRLLRAEEVSLEVYNPRSLLTRVMPLYRP